MGSDGCWESLVRQAASLGLVVVSAGPDFDTLSAEITLAWLEDVGLDRVNDHSPDASGLDETEQINHKSSSGSMTG